jgi:DNA-binding NtrC family response regulator
MNRPGPSKKHRILVIDDNPAIHDDFRKILCRERTSSSQLEAAESVLFGETPALGRQSEFEIDSAFQGEQGLARVYHAIQEGRPYAMAFVDVRMPPGWDGIEVTPKLWVADPDLQIVICTAYSDYSWEAMFAKIGASHRMFILKKPFDREEVLQLAHSLTEKRRAWEKSRQKLQQLEKAVQTRYQTAKKSSEKLQTEMTEKLQTEITELKQKIRRDVK